MKTIAEVIFSHLDETGDEYDLRYSAAVRRLADDVERELSTAGFGPVKAAAAGALRDAADDFGATYHGNWLRDRAAAIEADQ
ncbi:MAG: hypothetical protein M3536_05875 [Actinomycetota bacterium]|nr:hypothetical protein [Actinomycetota bacterium]